MLVQWLVWGGDAPTPSGRLHSPFQREILASIMLGTTLMAGITGLFVGFINLSSLQPFYSSRLTRAYLGASNGDRFAAGSAALSAAEPLPNDDLALAAYVEQRSDGPHLGTLAPLHIINVTVNKTVDPAEQLVQRDRKGQPMAVLPFGFSIDQRWRDGFPKAGVFSAISRPLPVGQWIGTSGAAFSTGIGRETSLGMSLLMGAANVRLGTWWRSEVGGSSPKWTQWLARGFGAVFRTQTYLSYELRARFFGTKRNLQYLSDGGHFENTGIYELLRKRRGVRQIFACDCGADPHFGFEDLANLIRLARIDLGTDLVVQTEFEGELAHVFGAPGAFKPAVGRSGASPIPGVFEDEHLQYAKTTRAPRTPAALMLWATHVGETLPSVQIVILKPSVVSDVVADVQQYASEHPTFPQETTADQFFNEAQWESYRALGYHLATKIFNERMLGAIEALANKRMRPADLKRFD